MRKGMRTFCHFCGGKAWTVKREDGALETSCSEPRKFEGKGCHARRMCVEGRMVVRDSWTAETRLMGDAMLVSPKRKKRRR